MKIFQFVFLSALMLLTGCSTNMTVFQEYNPGNNDKFSYFFTTVNSSNEVPQETIDVMGARLKSALAKSSHFASNKDVEHNEIEVSFYQYNVKNTAARFAVGVLAGGDVIKTRVIVRNSQTKRRLAEFDVVSENNSAWGTTSGMIEDHADKIVNYLVANKK